MSGFTEEKTSVNQRVDDYYKIVLIGDSTVGKTGLLTRFTENPDFFFESLPTIGRFLVTKLASCKQWIRNGNNLACL